MHKDSAQGHRSSFPRQGSSTDLSPIEGNYRLTALTGDVLVPLLALVFVTGVFKDAWWHAHYVVGFVLIPVVALKLASTGYRALRYYTRDPIYVAEGPPALLPRLLAPLLTLSMATALATGVILFAERSRSGVLSTIHIYSAVVSAVLIGLHFRIYVAGALAATHRELRARLSLPGRLRLAVVVAALVLGIILAILTYSSGVWPARPHAG
ncbi:MAG TPA: hypothetical protein VHB98_18180 [Chloroflexota bacterium]|nr:hypothetical protein [Chloroflexota bacterium]